MNHNHHEKQNSMHEMGRIWPMFVMYIVVFVLTGIKQYSAPSWNFHSAMNDFMGIMFIVWALPKFVNLNSFAQKYKEYDLLAKKVSFYGYLYPFIELTLGVCYLMRWSLDLVNWVTLIVMTLNAISVGLLLCSGKIVRCVCLGTVFEIPMTYFTLFENVIMAIMALMMIMRMHG